MEIKQEFILDSVESDGYFSIRKQNYIDFDGKRNYLGEPERRAFCPGEFDELKEYAPEFENVANAIWTLEVVKAWKQKRAEMLEQMVEV